MAGVWLGGIAGGAARAAARPNRRHVPCLLPLGPAAAVHLIALSLRPPICPLPLPTSGTENAHATSERPLYTLEVCMTGLAPRRAAQFFRSDDYVSAQHTTVASGIQGLVPGAGAGRLEAEEGRPQLREPDCAELLRAC